MNKYVEERYNRRKRRSAVQRLIATNPERIGLPPRHPKGHFPFFWLFGLSSTAAVAAVVTILVLIGSVVVGAYSVVTGFAASLPPADQLATVHVDQSTKIYDRYGSLLYEVIDPNGGRRTVIALNEIPAVVRQATIATEDPTFYSNPGIDPAGLARAFYFTFVQGRTVGGSTITQQLVKNNLLTNEVTFDRKIREAILSIEVSQKYSKDEILGAYLNTIPYGNLSNGIEAAANSYFGKDARELDLAQASLLAGLPQQPSVYDPCINPEAALNRQKDVLRLMNENKFITQDQIDPATKEMSDYINSDQFRQQCHPPLSTVAPHFVDWVRQVLEDKYGADIVNKGGLQVYTSLDPNIQKIAEDEVRKQIATLKYQHVTDGAVVVEEPKTGEILAMVGSPDYFNKTIHGQVNMAVSPRQPGSSIKPFNYLQAFRKGWTPATPILDQQSRFSQGQGMPPYIPVNYDGKFHGIVNVRYAIQNSLNVPAVRTLWYVTVPGLIDLEQQLGVTTLNDPNRFGLALTLGGGEVPLYQHTGAFGAFADYGKFVPPTPFTKIIDGKGNVILDNETNQPQGQQVFDPRLAYLMTSILTDNQTRTPEFGPASPLHLCADGSASCTAAKERPAAAKTGTTNDFRDNWTMGYTPELVVGVWVGNADNSQMINSTGITGAAPIWHNVLARIYKEIAPYNTIAPHPFDVPPGIVKLAVCKDTGMLAGGSSCPGGSYLEYFSTANIPPVGNGGFGGACVAVSSSPSGSGATGVKYTGGLPLFDDLARAALARGIPVGMAGLGCGSPSPSTATGPGNNNGGNNNKNNNGGNNNGGNNNGPNVNGGNNGGGGGGGGGGGRKKKP